MVSASEKAATDIENIAMRPMSLKVDAKSSAGAEPVKTGTKKVQDANLLKRRIEEADNEAAIQQIKISSEMATNKYLLDSRQITQAEYLAMEKETSKKQYDNELDLIKEKIKLQDGHKEEIRKLNVEKLKLNEKHNADVMAQDQAAALESGKVWRDYFKSFHDSIDKALTDMIMGTKSFMEAINAVGKQMLTELVAMGVRAATNWIVVEATKTLATTTGNATRMTQNQLLAAHELGLHATTATAEIATDAAVAGAGAAAQSAPYSGWGAIAIGAGVMASVLALTGNIKSSAGGEWRVASDRMNIVHKDETILPASIAGPLRASVESGGGLGGGGMTVNISAIDAKGVKSFFDTHGSSIADSLMKQKRDFKGGFA